MNLINRVSVFLTVLVIIGCAWFTVLERKAHVQKDANFQQYLTDHKCKRTGFVPSGKEIASIYTCDTGVWLASEIWNLKK